MASTYPNYMKVYCSFCYGDIDDQFFTRCSISRCTTPFFHDCCIGATSGQECTNWVCPKCTFEFNNRLNPSIEYTETRLTQINCKNIWPMVQPGAIEELQAMGQEANADNSEVDSKSSSNLDALTDEIRTLRTELAGLHDRFENLNTNLTHTSTRMDEVFSQAGTPGNNATQIEFYQVQILSLKDQMARFNESLKNQIELVGIPEREDEDLFAMVGLAAQKIGVRFHENDLDWAARVGSRPSSETAHNVCRPLVVRFLQKFKRDQFLRAGKATRNLMTNDLNVNCHPRRVYINERLSREIRCLFHEARFRSRLHGFKFCWIQNNSVFVRKSEGFPAVRLLSQFDLNTKLGDDLTPERDVVDNEPGEA